jgi:hypothetical protein
VRLRKKGVKSVEFPSWFQSAIQQRLDYISSRIERHPELYARRKEEYKAFQAMFNGVDKMQMPEFMEWEEKAHFTKAIENEHLYLQGMRDGAQLVFAFLTDPFPSGEEMSARKTKTEPKAVQPEDGAEL